MLGTLFTDERHIVKATDGGGAPFFLKQVFAMPISQFECLHYTGSPHRSGKRCSDRMFTVPTVDGHPPNTSGNGRQIRRQTYNTEAAKARSIRALFIGLRLLCMV